MGFRVIERWALSLGVDLRSRRYQSRSGKAFIEGRGVILLCPQTYMNLSGMAVRSCIDYYGVELRNVLVVHDDIDLPVGKIKVTRNGSAGGHKGVQSIIDSLGTSQFARLKMGVGRPPSFQPVEEFVLRPFSPPEETIVEEVLELAVRGCEVFVLKGLEQTMNDVNRQIPGQKE